MFRRGSNCNNDEQIIEGLISNNPTKIEEAANCLYKRFRKKILKIGYKLNRRDKEEGNDVIQETMQALYEGFKKRKFHTENLGGLVYRIAYHKWIDQINRNRNDLELQDVFWQAVKEDSDLSVLVHECLEYMAEDCKTIIIDYWQEEKSLEQIARDLEKPYGSTKHRHIKCRKILRACVERKMKNNGR